MSGAHTTPKPCPFCGSAEVDYDRAVLPPHRTRVTCRGCGAMGPEVAIDRRRDDEPTSAFWGRVQAAAYRGWDRRDGDRCAAGCALRRAVREFDASIGEGD